jgi:hypothetical protein
MPGHWEGDFIKGAGNKSSVGVLVERTSRLVLPARMEDATAASVLAGFTAKLNAISAPLRQSLTYDQCKEMTRHAELAANTSVRVYFCDPHSDCSCISSGVIGSTGLPFNEANTSSTFALMARLWSLLCHSGMRYPGCQSQGCN